MPASPSHPDPTPRLGRSILALTLARTAVNGARRFAYPFIPALARGLAAPLAAVQAVVAVQEGVGVLSPLFGPLAERLGRRRLMLAALALSVLAALAGAAFPRFAVVAAAMVLMGLGKIVYDPAMQAWLGDRVPYRRRGLALGVTELSWAGGLLVTAPLVGALLAGGGGIRGVFLLLAGMLAVGALLVALLVPCDAGAGSGAPRRTVTLPAAWRALSGSRAGRGALGFSTLLVAANEIFFINMAVWLERSFGLALTALGAVALAIGGAEVAGELLTVAIVDRAGKRRCALAGAAVSSFAYLALPVVGGGLAGAVAVMVALFVGFEVAVVASIPLFTEILPDARAVMMSGNTGAHAVGRLLGAALGGGLLAATGSFALAGAAAMALGLGAVMLMLRLVPEGD